MAYLGASGLERLTQLVNWAIVCFIAVGFLQFMKCFLRYLIFEGERE